MSWATYPPGLIPTKSDVPELEAFLAEAGSGVRLLDLGCGVGRLSHVLARRGYDVTGVDINERAIAIAREGEGEFHVRDIVSRSLELSGAPFRIVVCQLVVSVVGGPAEREALLRNAFDVLEPGGLLYVSASGVSDDINPGYRKLYADDFAQTGEHYTYFSRDTEGKILYRTHHFTVFELRALLELTGFEVKKLVSRTETSSRRPDQAARFHYAHGRRPE